MAGTRKAETETPEEPQYEGDRPQTKDGYKDAGQQYVEDHPADEAEAETK